MLLVSSFLFSHNSLFSKPAVGAARKQKNCNSKVKRPLINKAIEQWLIIDWIEDFAYQVNCTAK